MIKYGYEDGRKGFEAKTWIDGDTLKIKIYGSDHWWEYLINFKAWPRRFGFHPGWFREAEKLYEFICDAYPEADYKDVAIIGLSAGGAIGAIMSFFFPVHVNVITVNSPSHGKKYRMNMNIIAMVHRGDIVRYFPIFYPKPTIEKYGNLTWFWKAHNNTPKVWKEF